MVTLRPPSSVPTTESSPSVSPPTIQWLSGTWNVTHSTLPMWRKNRNVRITYTPIANTSRVPPPIDDVVSYQPLSSKSVKTVHGVDKPFSVANTAPPAQDEDSTMSNGHASLGYNWRGKGWLMIASSKWEILGYGDEESTDNAYVVTYFAKTMFTPAGVDIYSRKGKLKPETVESIKAGLAGLGGEVAKLAGEIFEVVMDEERQD